jgi:exodeoxyribonuclease VII large subunit
VLTGIGHEVDESLADLVSHTAFKTPTAVAAFLIERGVLVESTLQQLDNQIGRMGGRLLQDQYLRLEQLRQRLTGVPGLLLQQAGAQLDRLEVSLRLLAPQETLKRGYWLLEKEGRPLRADQVAPGSTLELVGYGARWKVTLE